MDRQNLLIIGIMLTALLTVGSFVINAYVMPQESTTKRPDPYRATISGQQVCLPSRDTSLPVTMECAIGLRTDSGKYYALDYSLISQTIPEIQDNQRFTASGLVTPFENLSADYWQKYNIEGIFSVTDGVVIEPPRVTEEEPIMETPAPSSASTTMSTTTATTTAAVKCYVGGCSSQLCTSDLDVVSDCMYREEYACYQTATCEVQASGQCGWSETDELLSCLASSSDQSRSF